ncbi:MAG: sugar phosphate isomerase/epimerase [Bryobacteraceae bacterium]
MLRTNRRSFLAAAGVAALAGSATAAGRRPVRLGGPIFLKSEDPVELAREHRLLGYSAAYCPAVKAGDSEHIRAVEKAFAAENVVIAEVGAWVNMLDPDAEKRLANLKYVVERMALAEAVGARCCVDIAGSYNPKVWYGPHPKNLSKEFFDATVENCRHIIDEIKPKRSRFTVEAMGWAIPDGPDSYLRLIKAVDRPAFGVHLDVCNIINSPERFYRNSDVITDCFRKLGPWIVSCHAKDLAWLVELNVHFNEVIPGRGEIDYRTYLTELAKLSVDAPLMLEHLKTAEEYEEGKRYIQKVAAESGVTFA